MDGVYIDVEQERDIFEMAEYLYGDMFAWMSLFFLNEDVYGDNFEMQYPGKIFAPVLPTESAKVRLSARGYTASVLDDDSGVLDFGDDRKAKIITDDKGFKHLLFIFGDKSVCLTGEKGIDYTVDSYDEYYPAELYVETRGWVTDEVTLDDDTTVSGSTHIGLAGTTVEEEEAIVPRGTKPQDYNTKELLRKRLSSAKTSKSTLDKKFFSVSGEKDKTDERKSIFTPPDQNPDIAVGYRLWGENEDLPFIGDALLIAVREYYGSLYYYFDTLRHNKIKEYTYKKAGEFVQMPPMGDRGNISQARKWRERANT